MKARILISAVVVMAVMPFIMAACGGGGGGSSTSLSESVNYSGQALPAVIDTNSAVQLALDSTVGGTSADEYGGGLFLNADTGSGDTGGLALVKDPGSAIAMMKTLKGEAVPVQPLGLVAEPLSIQCQSMVLDTTPTGGSVTLQICADPNEYYGTRYWVRMSMVFDEYDAGGNFQDGTLVVQGTFDETIGPEGDFDGPVTVAFRDLVTVNGITGEDSYIDGWAVYVETGGTVAITYNVAIIDSASGKSCWMDDYTLTVDYDNDLVTLSGRFYDATAGYVDLVTEVTLEWDVDMDVNGELVWNDDHPTAGRVKLTGADGYWISITFTPTGYYLQVNYTGDDAADINLPDIGEFPWI